MAMSNNRCKKSIVNCKKFSDSRSITYARMSARARGFCWGRVKTIYLRSQLSDNIESTAEDRLATRPKNHKTCVAFGVDTGEGAAIWTSSWDGTLELLELACNW